MNMRYVLSVFLVFIFVSPARCADEKLPLTLVIAGNAADWASTKYALSTGLGQEANPVVRSFGITPMKIAGTALEVYVVHRLWKDDHKKMAIATGIMIGGLYGVIATHNVMVIRQAQGR